MGQALSGSRIINISTLISALLASVIFEAWKTYKKKPQRPPPPPPNHFNISEDDLIRRARTELGMDVVNHYNYAVCGPRGTGKSTFINAIRGLDNPGSEDNASGHDPQKAAPVGITETTDKILLYGYPQDCCDQQNIKLWDVPGSGTVNHPSETYFHDKVLYAFDSLLITSALSFGGEQIRILEEAQKYGTHAVIIITKMDDVVNDKVSTQFRQRRRYHPTLDEYRPIVEQTIAELKLYVQKQQNIVPPSRIFVVSAKKFRDYLESVKSEERDNVVEDGLLAGEMDKLIEHLANEASHRRH